MSTAFTMEFDFRGQRFNDAAVGLQEFYKVLEKDWDGAASQLSKSMREFLTQVVQAIATRDGGAWPGGTSATSLSKRSGDLIAAIAGSVKVNGSTFATIEGEIGAPGIPYARIQETGGTISAKNGKFLCIPLPSALDGSGRPLQSSPRNWPNTFCARSKAGNLLIFQKRGTQIIPLYVLKTSVTLPPRLNMRTTIEAGVPYFVNRAMDDLVRAVQKG
jgi:hypothetical protein